MKLLGGKWSKGDILALIGVMAAILAIPGMPKLMHWDDRNPAPEKLPDPPPHREEVKKPEPTLHDADESGIKYHVTWSIDANCTGWQRQVAANPKLAEDHSCEFSHTQTKIGQSADLFDHWNIAVRAPSDVYDVDCHKNGFQLFEDGTDGQNNNHKGVAAGTWGRCTGYINGGDDPVTVTAYYRVLR